MKRLLTSPAWARCFGSALILHIAGIIHAQGIVHVAPNPQPYYTTGSPDTFDANIDVIGDGTIDFILESGHSFVSYMTLTPQNDNQVVVQNGFVADMNRGDIIGSSLASSNQWANGRLTIGLLAVLLGDIPGGNGEDGNFAHKPSGYIGFDLVDNGTNYYGWMYALCPSLGGLTGDAGIFAYITDWAFETSPNTPIQAGQITANITGANEMPPNRSANSGTGTFTLESFLDGFILTYHVELDGWFQPTDAGIFGPTGEGRTPVLIADLGQGTATNPPPPVYVPLVTTFDSPSSPPRCPAGPISWVPSLLIYYDGQINMSSNQVMQLLHGELYVNLKSSRFRQGELRGDILPMAPIQFSATLRNRPEFSRNSKTQFGEAVFTLSGANLTCNVALDTNVSWRSMGIYDAPIALPQALVVPLTNFFGVAIPPGDPPEQVLYPEAVTLTDRQVSLLMKGQLFLQILTSNCRNGTIGGRITQTP